MNFRDFIPSDFNSVIDLWTGAGLKISLSDTMQGLEKKLRRDPDLFFV